MAKYIDYGNDIRLHTGYLTKREELELYKKAALIDGFVVGHRPRKERDSKKPIKALV